MGEKEAGNDFEADIQVSNSGMGAWQGPTETGTQEEEQIWGEAEAALDPEDGGPGGCPREKATVGACPVGRGLG